MKVVYKNQQDGFDSMNGTVFSDGARLGQLLDERRRQPPFGARLSGDNGYELMIALGGKFGSVQYSRSDGSPPYVLAMSANPPMKNGGVEFFVGNTPTPFTARHIIRFAELKEIALHFLETGRCSNSVAWEEVGRANLDLRGRWWPSAKQKALWMVLGTTSSRKLSASIKCGGAEPTMDARVDNHDIEVRYINHLNKFDPLNGTRIVRHDQLAGWLDGRRKDAPFIVELSANNGFQLALGVGTGVGFAQFRRFDGNRPYFMALPAARRVKRGSIDFLMDMMLAPIPARYILNFDELKRVALHFLATGERSDAIGWEPV
jgi:hypothetical protein